MKQHDTPVPTSGRQMSLMFFEHDGLAIVRGITS